MSVKFTDDTGVSEGAVDEGGPRREFLHFISAIWQQGVSSSDAQAYNPFNPDIFTEEDFLPSMITDEPEPELGDHSCEV